MKYVMSEEMYRKLNRLSILRMNQEKFNGEFFNPDEAFGGNFDDAYDGGLDDGQTQLAREIIEDLRREAERQ